MKYGTNTLHCSVYFNNVLASFLPGFLTVLAQQNAEPDAITGKIKFFGTMIEPSSYFTYLVAISVVLQVFVFLSTGAMADFGAARKKLLILVTLIGTISTILFAVIVPSIYEFGGFLLVISNIAFGSASIYYNSFLPLLVKNHPLVRNLENDPVKKDTVTRKLDNRISSIGFIVGYIGGVVLLVISIGVFFFVPTGCEPRCANCPNENTDICPAPPTCSATYDPATCDPNYIAYRICLGGAGISLFNSFVVKFSRNLVVTIFHFHIKMG